MELRNYPAGIHLLVDLWGVRTETLMDETFTRDCLENAATDANATVLGSHFHHFGEGYGLSGVILLAESHISIHTWPERNFAAIDVFMCGDCDPRDSIRRILEGFAPTNHSVREHDRG